MNKILHFLTGGLLICCSILFTVLTVGSFLVTTYVRDSYQIKVLLRWDNPVYHILFLLLFLILLYSITDLYDKLFQTAKPLLFTVCLWTFFLSLACSYFTKTGPTADCASVYYAALQFAQDYLEAVIQPESYFNVYPFQLGLTFFYELIYRLSPTDSFHIIQGVNAVLLVVIVISQYKLVECFFHSRRCQEYYLLLAAGCLPLIFYGSYVYGEIPSIAFLSLSVYLLALFFEHQKKIWGILALLSCICGMVVRKNSLIFLVALGIVFILYLLKELPGLCKAGKIRLTSFLAIFLILSALALPMVLKSYELRADTKINDGVPSSTYFAMGLMEGLAGPGHYSAFNFVTFTQDADFDPEIASELALNAYKDRLQYFVQHPSYSISFLSRKFANQWMNAGWSVFSALQCSYGERRPVIESCFSGFLYHVLVGYMEKHQLVMYLLCLIYCLKAFQQRKDTKTSTLSYVFPLTIFGGALFSIIWEANGRYVFPYAIFSLPYCAMGAEWLKEILDHRRKK